MSCCGVYNMFVLITSLHQAVIQIHKERISLTKTCYRIVFFLHILVLVPKDGL